MSCNSDQNQRRRHYVDQLVLNIISAAETVRKEVDSSCREEYVSITERFRKIVDKVLKYTEERLASLYKEFQIINVNDEETLRDLKNYFLYMESHHTQKYKNRNPNGTTVEYVQATQGETSGWTHKYLHQEVLTKIHSDFLEEVNLDGTCIMDKLIGDQLMTEDERHSIIQERTPKRRKEAFLYLMKGKLSSKTLVNNFIPAIEKDHPEVAEKIKALAVEVQACPPVRTVCAVCNMKQTVQVKHFVEQLQTHDILSTDQYEEFRSSRTNNAVKWSVLLSTVSNPKFITKAVKSKFPEVYNSLKNENATDLECKCPNMSCTAGSDVANLDDLWSMLGSVEGTCDGESLETMSGSAVSSVTRRAVPCPQQPVAQRPTPCTAIQRGGSLALEMNFVDQENRLHIHRQKIVLQMSALNAATAQLVISGREDFSDYNAVSQAIYKITSNLRQFICDLEVVASLQEKSTDKLKNSARRLVDAFVHIQSAAKPGTPKDTLPGLTKTVVTATRHVVQKVKGVAMETEDQEQQNNMIVISTKRFVFMILELAACAKVVAPSFGNPSCQELLSQAVKPVATSVQQIVIMALSVSDNKQLLKDLTTAALAVNGALSYFLQHIDKVSLQTGVSETI